jgi:hypothetical protein
MEGGDEKLMVDPLDSVSETLQADLEKSRFFTRTVPLHDPRGHTAIMPKEQVLSQMVICRPSSHRQHRP